MFQSTHPERGATLETKAEDPRVLVSIHAPRAGCDFFTSFWLSSFEMFQSTHPERGATQMGRNIKCGNGFNPRTPSGVRRKILIKAVFYVCFNPRTPSGVRLRVLNIYTFLCKFQSTHPERGATLRWNAEEKRVEFQSTHPERGATCLQNVGGLPILVSIHAPRAGCD